MKNYENDIFNIDNEEKFKYIALKAFHFQYKRNRIYRQWVDGLGIDYKSVNEIEKIPFLPIQFFKSHTIVSCCGDIDITFKSSGTTESIPSRHFVRDVSLYEKSFREGFRQTFGEANRYHILALLPSYLERSGSSLVYMMEQLIKDSESEHSGFYLHDFKKLHEKLLLLQTKRKPTMLWGVSYALLDFCEQYPMAMPRLKIVETGGMKGKRREMIREELHDELCKGFGVKKIGSEYGMTELLSQAYSLQKGLFKTPPWMKVMIRDVYDPFSYCPINRNGGINIIDFANIHSCCFIATDDVGIMRKNGLFEVLGRLDNSDVRGCNLLYS